MSDFPRPQPLTVRDLITALLEETNQGFYDNADVCVSYSFGNGIIARVTLEEQETKRVLWLEVE